jgi:membrane-associated protein
MKYLSLLPASALLAFGIFTLSVSQGLLPVGGELLAIMQRNLSDYGYLLILLIILLESIIYVGFYFPGQLFAVLLVVAANPSRTDIIILTLLMVVAATLGSVFNFYLGRKTRTKSGQGAVQKQNVSFKQLLLAMIHINSLAFFMFAQGAAGKSAKIIAFAGLLNLPYYLLLISATTVLSEEVMALSENNLFILSALILWLVISLSLDIKRHRLNRD